MGMEQQRVGTGDNRSFPKGKVELVTVGETTIGRGSFEPGWHWAEHVKPIAGTESCQTHHIGYAISGQCGIRLDDGTESVIKAGDAYDIPAGHDGWVIGEEPYLFVDVALGEYAKPKS